MFMLIISLSLLLPKCAWTSLPGECYFNPLLLGGTCSSHYTDPAALLIEEVFLKLADADCELYNPCNFPPHYSPKEWEEFDFIVVGAGTAGSVVANRLSEIAGWTVLLIEAGGDPPKTSAVPRFFSQLYDTNVDWQYKTDSEEPNCLGSVNSQCKMVRGKMLGGCSSINGMLYVRGNHKDYDGWEAEGNIGWGYRDVLPYFKKSEDMRAPGVKCTPDFYTYHGLGGPLKVDDFSWNLLGTLPGLVSTGLTELGFTFNPDNTGRTQSGFCRQTGTLEDGRRCSTATAFLSPVKDRNNLKVSKNTLVTKVLIDEVNRKAYGVEFVDSNGYTVKVLAKKEVIVSGGTINSPQLLMLSGVGPKEHLTEFGIKVISDLPVGKNLQDHPVIFGLLIALDFSIPELDLNRNMFNFLLKYNNSFAGQNIANLLLFMDADLTGIDYANVQWYFYQFNKNSLALLDFLDSTGYNDEVKSRYQEINAQSPIIIMNPALIHPRSRGSIRLQSSNPFIYPKLTMGYFSDPRDVDTLIRAIDLLRGLPYTNAFKDFGARYIEIGVSSCYKFPLDSRSYRECFLRNLNAAGLHIAGTCHMGPPGHPDTVVDPQLRVQGVSGLRVVDASVMPKLIRGNPYAATIMIAEKGSDLIKHTWFSTPYKCAEGFVRSLPYPVYK